MGNVHTVTHLCHTETVGGATAVRFTCGNLNTTWSDEIYQRASHTSADTTPHPRNVHCHPSYKTNFNDSMAAICGYN